MSNLFSTVDRTAPVILSSPSDQQVSIDPNSATPTGSVTFTAVNAVDQGGGPVTTAYISAPAGVIFQANTNTGTVTASNIGLGTTVVTFTATDQANNPSVGTFNIVGTQGKMLKISVS